MNNWEKLCKQINPLISKGVNEDILHSQFESCLQTFFNWDDANILHKPSVQFGREKKEADIVLKGNDFGIVIEMKRPDIELDDEAKSQLTSYMRGLKYKYGFLIGNEMVIFYDDDTMGEQPLEAARFDFDIKNTDGVSLCDILSKEVCSNEELKEYMLTRIKRKQENEKNERLKNELLSNNGTRIKEILKEKLLLDGYKEEVINNIISDISIYSKNHMYGGGNGSVPPPPIPRDNMGGRLATEETQKKNLEDSQKDFSLYSRKQKDTTKYQLNGQTYGKGRLVLGVIKSYIKENPNVTLEKLQDIFLKKLQGSVGVIGKYEDVVEKYKNIKHKRHFLNDSISLNNGEKIVVCTEWGISNIGKFIDKAKELGFVIGKK